MYMYIFGMQVNMSSFLFGMFNLVGALPPLLLLLLLLLLVAGTRISRLKYMNAFRSEKWLILAFFALLLMLSNSYIFLALFLSGFVHFFMCALCLCDVNHAIFIS